MLQVPAYLAHRPDNRIQLFLLFSRKYDTISYIMLQIDGRAVAMDTTGAILWRATEVDDGMLYLPSQPEDEERTVDLLTSTHLGTLYSDEGNDARVYLPPAGQPNDVVIKEYRTSTSRHLGGLQDLRINVLVEAGLAQMKQDDPYWQFRGARILGAFVPENTAQGSQVGAPARWVLERVVTATDTVEQLNPDDRADYHVESQPLPDYDDSHPLPPLSAIDAFCERALEKTIGDRTRLQRAKYTHDVAPANALIERLPEGVGRWPHRKHAKQKGSVVMIDANAFSGFDY